jgi:hypothetical protein
MFIHPTASSADLAVAVNTEALRRQRLLQLAGGNACLREVLGLVRRIVCAAATPVQAFERADVPPLRGRGGARRSDGRRRQQNRREGEKSRDLMNDAHKRDHKDYAHGYGHDEIVANFVASMIPECRERGFGKCRAIGIANADGVLLALRFNARFSRAEL